MWKKNSHLFSTQGKIHDGHLHARGLKCWIWIQCAGSPIVTVLGTGVLLLTTNSRPARWTDTAWFPTQTLQDTYSIMKAVGLTGIVQSRVDITVQSNPLASASTPSTTEAMIQFINHAWKSFYFLLIRTVGAQLSSGRLPASFSPIVNNTGSAIIARMSMTNVLARFITKFWYTPSRTMLAFGAVLTVLTVT